MSKVPECVKHNPVSDVIWVPLEKIHANDYNPNTVATEEMRLLYISIREDGYTQPIVTFYDKARDRYVIVDGFHRYSIMKFNKDIRDRNGGMLPVVVIDKPLKDRVASTVRHNRARGKHSVEGMSNLVFKMLEEGCTDDYICNRVGLSADELARLKHITGFSRLFANVEYRQEWETKKQVMLRKEHGA